MPFSQVTDSTGVVLDGCTISDHGSMGVNITGGAGCGVRNSNVAGNGP
jgi:parallel beta-helix repeat protein